MMWQQHHKTMLIAHHLFEGFLVPGHTSATLNHTLLTPLVARLSPRPSCNPLTTASGTSLHAAKSISASTKYRVHC